MRVVEQLIGCAQRRGRNAEFAQQIQPFLRRALEEGFGELAVDRIDLRRALRECRQFRSGPAWLHGIDEQLPVLVVVDQRRDMTILGAIRLAVRRSEEHTSELKSLMRISYAVFCLKKKQTLKHQ